MISSTSNAKVKNVIQLKKKGKLRKEQGVFLVEGIKMVKEAKQYGQLEEVFVMESFYETQLSQDQEFFTGLSYEIVTDKVFLHMSDTVTPQGIMALVKMPSYTMEQILQADQAHLMLLEDLRDPGNLGTIIRAGEGAGITGVILSKECVDVFNPKVIRSTMGSVFRVPFCYVEDFYEAVECIKDKGISLYAAHLKGKNNYEQENYTSPCGFMIGNEANGLSDQAAELADHYIKIPMAGQVESLNAAIAASILMYETARQRRV